MKKIYLLIAAIAVFASCSYYPDSIYYEKNERLKIFCTSMATTMLSEPVQAMETFLQDEKKDIFKQGFSERYSDILTVELVSAKDSLWKASISSGGFTAECTIRLKGMTTMGLHEWICTGSGHYLEDSGYSANIKIEDDAKYYWEKQISSTFVGIKLLFDASCVINTYFSSKNLDTCVLQYTGAETGYPTVSGTSIKSAN